MGSSLPLLRKALDKRSPSRLIHNSTIIGLTRNGLKQIGSQILHRAFKWINRDTIEDVPTKHTRVQPVQNISRSGRWRGRIVIRSLLTLTILLSLPTLFSCAELRDNTVKKPSESPKGILSSSVASIPSDSRSH